MTQEAQSNHPRPEGISNEHQQRFEQLQTHLIEQLKVQPYPVIVRTSDPDDPLGGYHLSLHKDGSWSIGTGREGIKFLNGPHKLPNKPGMPPTDPKEPVKLIEILKSYAFIQRSAEFDELVVDPQYSFEESIAKRRGLRKSIDKSVDENPGPYADSFLEHMENTLKQLSGNRKI
ncbi:MAG: hypothetical protein AAB583_01350 [Patescibacteria group bacterium]